MKRHGYHIYTVKALIDERYTHASFFWELLSRKKRPVQRSSSLRAELVEQRIIELFIDKWSEMHVVYVRNICKACGV